MRQRGLVVLLFGLTAGPLLVAAELERPPLDEETGRYSYQDVVSVEGVPDDDLYSRAKAWVATAYTSANDVIQLDDAAAGRLIVKGNFAITYYLDRAWIHHTLTVEVKDGRYRYTLTDFVFENEYWSAPLEMEKKFVGQKKKVFRQVIEHAEATIAGLGVAMVSASPVGDDDW